MQLHDLQQGIAAALGFPLESSVENERSVDYKKPAAELSGHHWVLQLQANAESNAVAEIRLHLLDAGGHYAGGSQAPLFNAYQIAGVDPANPSSLQGKVLSAKRLVGTLDQATLETRTFSTVDNRSVPTSVEYGQRSGRLTQLIYRVRDRASGIDRPVILREEEIASGEFVGLRIPSPTAPQMLNPRQAIALAHLPVGRSVAGCAWNCARQVVTGRRSLGMELHL